MEYPKKRDLDGIYFRVCRDGKWQNICMTDLTKEDFDHVTADRCFEWLQSAFGHLMEVSEKMLDFASGTGEAREMLWDLICLIRKGADQMGLSCVDDDDE